MNIKGIKAGDTVTFRCGGKAQISTFTDTNLDYYSFRVTFRGALHTPEFHYTEDGKYSPLEEHFLDIVSVEHKAVDLESTRLIEDYISTNKTEYTSSNYRDFLVALTKAIKEEVTQEM